MFVAALKKIGLIGLTRQTVEDFLDDDMPTYAAALAYQMLFSLFPFLLVLIALVGFLHIPEFFAWLQEQAALLLPEQVLTPVNAVITQLQQQQGGVLSIGLIIALWSSSAGIRSMTTAFNAAYDVKETRPLWRRFLLSIFYTIATAILLLIVAGLMILGPQIMTWIAAIIGLEEYVVTVWTWIRLPLAIFLMMLIVAQLYHILPNVKHSFRLISPGSILSVLAWIGASLAYGYYVRNFANYNAMYGSIGAIIILLLYFYLSAAMVLFGAELNSVLQRNAETVEIPPEADLTKEN